MQTRSEYLSDGSCVLQSIITWLISRPSYHIIFKVIKTKLIFPVILAWNPRDATNSMSTEIYPRFWASNLEQWCSPELETQLHRGLTWMNISSEAALISSGIQLSPTQSRAIDVNEHD